MIGEKKYMNILHSVASGLHGHSMEMSGLHYTCSWRMYTEGIHVLCIDNLLKELNVFEFDH